MKSPYSVKELFKTGEGEVSILDNLGRLTDFKGVFVLLNEQKPVYVGHSKSVIKRLINDLKGASSYKSKLLRNIAKRDRLFLDQKGKYLDLESSRNLMRSFDVAFIEVNPPIERRILFLYALAGFKCKYNRMR